MGIKFQSRLTARQNRLIEVVVDPFGVDFVAVVQLFVCCCRLVSIKQTELWLSGRLLAN